MVNFNIKKQYGTYTIYPDVNFMKIYENYCKLNNLNYNDKLVFECSILPEDISGIYNKIDSEYLIPNELQGLSIGYKIYKLLLNKVYYIMSLYDNSTKAKNLWFNLLLDNDVYSGTNSEFNIIISKNIPDNLLDDILNKVKTLKLKYDDELNERINSK